MCFSDLNLAARLRELQEAKAHPQAKPKPAPQPQPEPKAKPASPPKPKPTSRRSWWAVPTIVGMVVLAAAGAAYAVMGTKPSQPVAVSTPEASSKPGKSLPKLADGTPAPATAPQPEAPPAPVPTSGRTYVVKTGDTLITIGEQIGKPWQDIDAANNIGPPYLIYNGNVLKIP